MSNSYCLPGKAGGLPTGFILTGASRGMGLAMAEQLLAQQNHLLCISRHANPSLASVAEQRNCPLAQWTLDLSQPEPAWPTVPAFARWHRGSSTPTCKCNCAAPIAPIFRISPDLPSSSPQGNSALPVTPPSVSWPGWPGPTSASKRSPMCATVLEPRRNTIKIQDTSVIIC